MSGDDRSDAALVAAVRSGDTDAYGVLFERWFDRVYDVARNIVRNPDTAADVAQDTFISAWERLDRLENVEAFGGWLLRSARNRALDRLEREGRSRPQADDVVTGLHDRGAPDLVGSQRGHDTAEISAGRDRDGLIGAAAVALGERDASILDLHLRHGLSAAEIAAELGVTPNNAHQLLFRMRNKLGNAIGAYVLWHRGQPVCATLRADVASIFDADTFAAVEHHRRRCDECTERRAALVAPEQLFSAAPMLVAPLLLRNAVRDALHAAGVPVSSAGDAHVEPGDGGDGSTDTQHPSEGTGDGSGGATGDRSGDGFGNGSGDVDGDGDGDESGDSSFVDSRDLVHAESRADHPDRRRIGIVMLAAAALVLATATGGVIALDALRSDSANVATGVSDDVGTSDSTSTSLAVSQAGTGSAPTTIAMPGPTTTATSPSTTVAVLPVQPAATAPTIAVPGAPPPAAPPSATNAPENQPATTAPSPPATAPQTTVPPSTAAPTTVAPPAAPSVVELFFSAAPGGVLCSGSATPRRIGWMSNNATSARLDIGATTRTVPVNGQLTACAASGDLVTLTVTGPGGSDSSSMIAP